MSDDVYRETAERIFESWDEWGKAVKRNREQEAKERLAAISRYYSNQRSATIESIAMERGRLEA